MPPWAGYESIPIETFDEAARGGSFEDGPFVSTFGDGYGQPYTPDRTVWGTLKDGRQVRSVKAAG